MPLIYLVVKLDGPAWLVFVYLCFDGGSNLGHSSEFELEGADST